ncbi:MAG TPA: GMC family oxidoreductase N-terminal domain-containing protein [Candidatus Limnocylindrales bacterium]|nr:GMC family oxidoreductase N-terminal domain-containing protein [Candidatus Limnocylindrales bacterium]
MSSQPPTIPPGWSVADLATLAELAETFVRGGSVRRSNLAAEALARAADPAQVRQLRLVLRLFESRLANLLLTGRPIAFRDRTPADRERVLLAWANSRLPLRRSAYQAFRKLLTFLAYADPGPPGIANPLHAAIGYIPERPPVTALLAAIRPLDIHGPPTGADDAVQLDADVVVVGSGAGGGVIAAELARAGRSVVVVEAGPFLDEAHLPTDELDAYSRVYLNHGLLTTWDGAITMLAGTAVGGGTLVNWMTSIAPPDDVRAEWASDHGIDGIDGAEFDADLQTIEVELGVAPATAIPPKDAVILRGAANLGWEAAPIRRNATDCGDCGSCPFGCPRGAKQSGMRAHLATAVAAGARVVDRARVTRVLIVHGRVVGVEADVLVVDPATGEPALGPGGDPLRPRTRRLVVRTAQVVVAAGALRSPAVLLASGLDHPAIGRHLRLHPAPVVAGLFDDPIEMWRGTMQAARSLEFSRPAGARNGYVIESAPGHPGLIALALPWEGTDAHADLLGRIRHVAPLIAVTRDGGAGRVRLAGSGRARIDYALDERGVATLRHAMVSMAGIVRAAGARQIVAVGTPPRWHGRSGFAPGQEERSFVVFEDGLRSFDFGANRGSVFSAHQMGSVRMGAAVNDHPCDPAGRVRTRSGAPIPGLYVGDGSLFPTGLGVNPMITIMALARRVARTVAAEVRSG